MIIEINDNKAIADIQDKFSSFFPYLKIEFYKHPHHWYQESDPKTAYPKNNMIGEIRKKHPHGDLEIHSWYRTGDLEQVFHKKFDLNVQVFKLIGDEWIQTAGTDKLTLKEQNEVGRKACGECEPGRYSESEKENLC